MRDNRDILDKLKWLSADMEYMEVPGDWLLPVNEAHSIIVRMREKLEENDLYVKTWSDDYDAMKVENNRLRVALEWIAGTALTEPEEMVEKARAALGEKA